MMVRATAARLLGADLDETIQSCENGAVSQTSHNRINGA
jgi:hypothetical protein